MKDLKEKKVKGIFALSPNKMYHEEQKIKIVWLKYKKRTKRVG